VTQIVINRELSLFFANRRFNNAVDSIIIAYSDRSCCVYCSNEEPRVSFHNLPVIFLTLLPIVSLYSTSFLDILLSLLVSAFMSNNVFFSIADLIL